MVIGWIFDGCLMVFWWLIDGCLVVNWVVTRDSWLESMFAGWWLGLLVMGHVRQSRACKNRRLSVTRSTDNMMNHGLSLNVSLVLNTFGHTSYTSSLFKNATKQQWFSLNRMFMWMLKLLISFVNIVCRCCCCCWWWSSFPLVWNVTKHH